jgi:integrase
MPDPTLIKSVRKPIRIGRRLYEFELADGRRSYRLDFEINGVQHRRTLEARNRTEARAEVKALGAKQLAPPSRRTVAEVAEEFLESLGHKVAAGDKAPRTFEEYGWRLRSRVVPLIGSMQIQKVGPDEIEDMIARWRARGDSPGTILSTRTTLSKLVRFALRRGYISESPLAALESDAWPRVEKSARRVLGLEEIRKLIAKATDGTRALVALLALSGLRQSEALGLVWGDLDFEAGLIHVRAQLSRPGGSQGERIEVLKTDAALRDVLLHPGLASVLRQHKAESFQRGQAKPEDFVFSTASGLPLSHRNASRALDLAAEKAGIEGLTTHGLRHGFVSWLILELDFDPMRVSRQVGHKSASFTMDTYTHLFEQAGHHNILRARIAESDFGRVLDEGV